jgi:hypothetical protein
MKQPLRPPGPVTPPAAAGFETDNWSMSATEEPEALVEWYGVVIGAFMIYFCRGVL